MYGIEAYARNSGTGRYWNITWYHNNYQMDASIQTGNDFDNNVSLDAQGQFGFVLRGTDTDFNMAWSSDVENPLDVDGELGSNQVMDPELVDPAGGDFHLSAGSPAIDAGNPYGWSDADGTRADLGAYGGPGGSW
jgi:hypothetical protein